MNRTKPQGALARGIAAGLLLPVALGAPSAAAAAEAAVGTETLLGGVEMHGFVSQGFWITRGNDYLDDDTTDGSFEFSEVGLNFTTQLTDTLRTGVQLFANDLGPSGDYKPLVDWFYLDYRPLDWLGIRAGRLKIPYGLYNEIQDIDSARVPVLLPQSVYPLQTREVLFAQTGAELYGFWRLGDSAGGLEYRLFGGTMYLDADALTPPGAGFELAMDVPHVVGGRLLWETPLDGLRVGGSAQALRLETTVFAPGIEPFVIENNGWSAVASLEYTVADWLFSAEYSRWGVDQSSDAPDLSPPIKEVSERAYVMASYQLTDWVSPGAHYSVLYPDTEQRSGRENRQHDVAVSFRFDINAHWLAKLEGHFMSGTAGLLNPLRINPPDVTQANQYWGAVFLKTTAHF
jgi:hypothetical protein